MAKEKDHLYLQCLRPSGVLQELGSQAISYTTGVPAMITYGTRDQRYLEYKRGTLTTDEFDPDPYMDMLTQYGLPWVVEENPVVVE